MKHRNPLTIAESTRYYMGRLWKISWVRVPGHNGTTMRTCKHYFKRVTVGSPWQYVRSAVTA